MICFLKFVKWNVVRQDYSAPFEPSAKAHVVALKWIYLRAPHGAGQKFGHDCRVLHVEALHEWYSPELCHLPLSKGNSEISSISRSPGFMGTAHYIRCRGSLQQVPPSSGHETSGWRWRGLVPTQAALPSGDSKIQIDNQRMRVCECRFPPAAGVMWEQKSISYTP